MMANKKDSKLNYHEEENAMVTDLDDLKELGKEELNLFFRKFTIQIQVVAMAWRYSSVP